MVLRADGLFAQWTNVAPGIVPAPSEGIGGGAIVYKSGIAWAGTRPLYLSKDEGVTWEQRSSPLNSTDYIRHLDFYDDSIGIIASNNGEIWITHDQAITWKRIRATSSSFAARFINSPLRIVIAGASSGNIEITEDGGITWKWVKIGTFVPFVAPLNGGTVYALVSTATNRKASHLYISTNYGNSWQPSSDSVEFDSYTFAVDACSPERIYVVNEDAGGATANIDGFSEIFITSNTGESWSTTYTKAGRDLVGSISLASNSIYVQRLNAGILRSTDFGNTWIDVGGPSMIFDSRMLCAITDNVVLASDPAGNIWRTTNAGGDSVHGEIRYSSISSSPEMLFMWDTLFSCDPPTLDTLVIKSVFCQPPHIVRTEIEGDHPNDFKLTSKVPELLTGLDTLSFEFMPRGNGERRANLRITFEDSTTIIVPMRGYGKGVTELLTTTADAATDTLGATVYLPIAYASDGEMTGVSMEMSWTSDQLEFVDVYDLLGVSIASPTSNPKRYILNFPSTIAQNGLIGHAAFRVYSGDDACMPVVFDSITSLTSRPACAFAINPMMSAQICVPNDCIATRVSNYLRYGKLPVISVIQVDRDLLLTVEKNFGDVEIRVISTLGVVEEMHTEELRADKPVRFSVSTLPEGLYFIEVRSILGIRTIKKVIHH